LAVVGTENVLLLRVFEFLVCCRWFFGGQDVAKWMVKMGDGSSLFGGLTFCSFCEFFSGDCATARTEADPYGMTPKGKPQRRQRWEG
jgi:hypothetical protein